MPKFKDLSRDELLEKLREIDKYSNTSEDVIDFRLRELSQLAELGKLSSLIFHEVSNSLTISILNTSLIETRIKNNQDITQELRKIETSQNKMKKILESVSRNVHISNQNEDVEINQFICEELIFITEILNKKNVTLTQELNALNGRVKVVPSQLAQVISNIIFNACDAIDEANRKTGNREIQVHTYNEENNCVIKIQDNGIGIEKENLNKIFQPFYTTKKRGRGTGFGLAVVTQIINDFNAIMEVESKSGIGSAFILKLPLK